MKVLKNIDKYNYLAIGLSNGKVRIYDQELNLYKEIKKHGNDNEKNEIEFKVKKQYIVTSLTTDEYGEYLFIGFKNGTIEIVAVNDNEIKKIIQNEYEINSILFEDKYFCIIFIGDNKGLRIRDNARNIKYFDDNYAPCTSFCFNSNKEYLFAGFGDGIIRVYHFEWIKDYF